MHCQQSATSEVELPASNCTHDVLEATGINITELPWDLLAHIFKRVPARHEDATCLAAVCRTFRRVCHAHATTAIITRRYESRRDGAAVSTLAQLPLLRVVDLSSRGKFKYWQWPISALTRVTQLTVNWGWPAKEVPPSLTALLILRSNNKGIPMRALHERMRGLPPRCVVALRHLECLTDSDWSMLACWPQHVHPVSCVLSSGGHMSSLVCLRDLGRALLRDVSIDHATGLTTLDGAEYCSALTSLSFLHCNDLTTLRPLAHANLPTLARLEVNSCAALAEFEQLTSQRLPKLEMLRVVHCPSLAHLAITGLGLLTALQLQYCPISVDFLSHCLPHLRELTLAMPSLQSLDWLEQRPANMASLQELRLYSCNNLTSLRGLRAAGCAELRTLSIANCSLTTLGGVAEAGLSQLTHLYLGSFYSLASLASLAGAGLVSLRALDKLFCSRLSSLEGLAAASVTALTRLSLHYCISLTSLRSLEGTGLDQLVKLNLHNCVQLASLQGLSRPGAVQRLEIDVRNCESLPDATAQLAALAQVGFHAVETKL